MISRASCGSVGERERHSMRRVMIISYTEAGRQFNNRLTEYFEENGDVAVSGHCGGSQAGDIMSTKELLRQEWDRVDAIVWIGALGIAVRCAAPFLESKLHDPAVLVLDEKGRFVVPVLSGHIGGGVALARELAQAVGGQAVITTATDVEERFAVDVFAGKNHLWVANPDSVKAVSGALLRGERVAVWTDLPIRGETPRGLEVFSPREESLQAAWTQEPRQQEAQTAVAIGLEPGDQERIARRYDPSRVCVLTLRPYILGIGCKKGKTAKELEAFLRRLCEEKGMSIHEIGAIASIDVKREEPGIWELSRRLRAPFTVFSAEELERVREKTASSDFVKKTVGVDNVCERSAYCLAQRWERGRDFQPDGEENRDDRLVVAKQALDGMTMAIVQTEPWLAW